MTAVSPIARESAVAVGHMPPTHLGNLSPLVPEAALSRDTSLGSKLLFFDDRMAGLMISWQPVNGLILGLKTAPR